MTIVIKSQETRDGVRFRILENDKYIFKKIIFQNYFYIKLKDYLSYENEFLLRWNRNGLIGEVIKSGNFAKIHLTNNFMRCQIRDWWEQYTKTYEADIKANKRFLLDKKLNLHNEDIPYCFFDIETEDVKPLMKDERGLIVSNGQRILSCSFYDYKGDSEFYILGDVIAMKGVGDNISNLYKAFNDEAEKELLSKIINKFAQYGIISGWNSVRFDMPYIKQRCDALGLKYQILDYINHIDYQEIFKKYERKTLKSYSLNSVSKYILKRQKIDQKKGNGAIYNTWKNNPEQLKEYNLEDSKLLYDINQERLFMEVSMHRANNAICHVQNVMHNSDSGDYYLMRRYKARSIIMPSKPTREEIQERMKLGKITGGFTNCFEVGFFDIVHVWDFKSMYPSVVDTWNISPETFVETLDRFTEGEYTDYIITPSNFDKKFHPHRIYKKKRGVFPEAARELVAERDKIKYLLTPELKKEEPAKYRRLYLEQYALKVDANSYFYGLLSFAPGRYFNWDVADSVTSACQGMIKPCYEKLKEWGCKVIGGDTDSTFTVLPEGTTVEMIDAKFIEYFNAWVKQWHIIEHCLVFEYEKKFEPMMFVAKKNYAYKMHGEINIVGMEAIKADSAIVGAQLQRGILEDILNGLYKREVWQQKLEAIYNRVYNQQLTAAELILVKGLTKMPNDYIGDVISKATGKAKVKADGTIQKKAIPAHVQLAERLMAKGIDLYPGSKMKFIVIKDKPILAISPEEYDLGKGEFTTKKKKTKEVIPYYWEGGYDVTYYWKRIVKPVIKVIWAYHKNLDDWDFYLSESQMNKILKDKEVD